MKSMDQIIVLQFKKQAIGWHVQKSMLSTLLKENKMKKIVLAFSGGLDTSFCVPYLIDKGFEVHTIFVNSGGVSLNEEKKISKRAYELEQENISMLLSRIVFGSR